MAENNRRKINYVALSSLDESRRILRDTIEQIRNLDFDGDDVGRNRAVGIVLLLQQAERFSDGTRTLIHSLVNAEDLLKVEP